MEDSNLLIGLLISVIFIGAAWWHMRENAQMERNLREKIDSDTAQSIMRFAWSRTFQLLGALVCTILLVISYDREISNTRTNMDTLSSAVEQIAQIEHNRAQDQKAVLEKLTSMATPPQTPPQVVFVPQPATVIPPIGTPNNQANPVYTQQVSQQTQQSINANALSQLSPAAAPSTIATPQQTENQSPTTETEPSQNEDRQDTADKLMASNNSVNAAINALYSPEKGRSDQQSGMDDIKRRYEDILVIHLFLKKCGKVKPTDYSTITSALGQEMAAIDAPSRLQLDVVSSAQGSYNEIYSKSPCDGKGIADLNKQYNNYIQILSQNFALPEE